VGAAVLVELDDEELMFVGEREPITLDGLKRLCHGLPEPRELMGPLCTRLAVDLAQRFDGITVANRPLQERYGGTVIPHARDPEQLKPVTAEQKASARQLASSTAVVKCRLRPRARATTPSRPGSYTGSLLRSGSFQAAMRSALRSTTVTCTPGQRSAITAMVGPPTYPAPMQQMWRIGIGEGFISWQLRGEVLKR
jgi:hypothetical protein